MATFRDLLIWQKSMLVVTDIYALLISYFRDLHSHRTIEAKCNFNSSNIAEGYGRQGTKDYLKFLNINCFIV
jgi:four helix bundle protein